MRKSFVLVLVLSITGMVWLVMHAWAANTSVSLNEIMYDFPGSDDPHEWVEVWNSGNTAVELTGWKFYDGANHALNVPPANGGQGSLMLNPETYAIFTDNAVIFLGDHPGFSGIVIDAVMSLNN